MDPDQSSLIWVQLIYSSPNYKIEPDFPCLADEIAEPRPDMNIKVAAFTISEKYTNTRKLDPSFLRVYGLDITPMPLDFNDIARMLIKL